ncbi:MAG: DegT/DnrJ/EryC1/StrS family aminotransferase [Sphingobacteriaceae bacterium]|jgi:UDP-2-acetamido-2-deoxy-ribo-hexuluronate aminotransferase|nr:DegT/DnrJ/EryC1/StrS family aminotransferase [Sphingobacteriaceae bacterium]MBK7309280.1 DegT/DnrJ/EryC1/StrS family aminotransferase [Sphingobacteriaceae bacterium]
MVDLKSQYEKIKLDVDKGIQEVINNTAFINGPAVKEFQKDLETYLNVKHVIPCANGTDALQIAMMALGLKPGDEVITADFTYVATAEVIGLLGLIPVLVDVKEDTFEISIEAIEKKITPKTKAIVPVHLYGQCCNMEAIMALAKKHNLFVIEDVAQALGADYMFADGSKKKAGTIGNVGCTSFFPSKNLGCYGDGGAMYTNDDELAAKLRMIAHHGQSKQYIHDVLGVNSRLDTIQAAVLKVKLKQLDNYAKARNNAADFYDKAFANHPKIKTPTRAKFSTHVFHQYTLKLNGVDRDKLREFLAERNIPSMIYYPIPLHKQNAFKSDRNKEADLPITMKLCASVISLPMHTELSNETLKFITDSVLEFCK